MRELGKSQADGIGAGDYTNYSFSFLPSTSVPLWKQDVPWAISPKLWKA
jgi:hypothetical protein